MPQKKNADSLELIRGKSGRIFGRVSERKTNKRNRGCGLPLENFWIWIRGDFSSFSHAATSVLEYYLHLFLLSVCGYADDVKGKTILIYCIFPSWLNSFFCIRGANKSLCSIRENHKGDVTRGDSQRGFLAQHRIVMLEQCCNNSKQCCNAVLG